MDKLTAAFVKALSMYVTNERVYYTIGGQLAFMTDPTQYKRFKELIEGFEEMEKYRGN